ncbi:hypothetical protein IVA96_00260 [Bradyrhizobium sp. 159]|uniref:hypothetical protein n=1 Tax=Bradyrhizobium sp. 182 TaxID=2782651 RepID=UPI001FF8D71D|nr:hypothetical protein [Bradyrhizobium sp. 182]MCK1615154.1 hypothetical protein [Bradyrhizobium sp. 159]
MARLSRVTLANIENDVHDHPAFRGRQKVIYPTNWKVARFVPTTTAANGSPSCHAGGDETLEVRKGSLFSDVSIFARRL